MVNNFADLSYKQFSNFGNKIAIKTKYDTITYHEFKNRISQLANVINNYTQKNKVLIVLDRSINLFVSIYATVFCDKSFIVLNKNAQKSKIDLLIKENDIDIYISDENIIPDLKLLNVNEVYFNGDFIPVDFINEIASIVYTSGSTKIPKAVLEKHSNIIDLIKSSKDILNSNFNANVLQFLDLSFTYSYFESFCTLFYGGTLYIIEDNIKTNIKSLYNFIERNNIETLFLPTAFFKVLIKLNQIENLPNTVKNIHIAGETIKIEKENVDKILQKGVSLYNNYGTTETLNFLIYKLTENFKGDDFLPCGKTFRNIEPFLDDKSILNVKSNSLFGGYQNSKTDGFINNDLFLSNDIAKINSCGDYIILGRNDNICKVNGYRVSLEEITEKIQNLENVLSCKVLFIKEESKLICFYTGDICEGELYENLIKILPNYSIPVLIKKTELPYLKSGKINSIQLVGEYKNKTYKVKDKSTFEKIKKILITDLKINESKIKENSTFEELSIDSLSYLLLIGNIEETFKINLIDKMNVDEIKSLDALMLVIEKRVNND